MTQEQKQKIGEGDYEIMKSYMNNPTPSDTFIEGKISEFHEIFKGANGWQGGEDTMILVNGIKDFLKSSLQEQRQSILEEIEKVIISFDDKKEEIIKGQRFLIDDKEKLPFGYPYPDTKEKYIISKIKQLLK